jgi:hypothetical protein
MFRQLTILILLLSFSMQSFYNVAIVAEYLLNPDKYAKVCVNKALPQLRCNGKCQMMKKLKEEENKERENPLHKVEKPTEIFSTFYQTAAIPVPSSELLQRKYEVLIPARLSNWATSLFHPPSLI